MVQHNILRQNKIEGGEGGTSREFCVWRGGGLSIEIKGVKLK